MRELKASAERYFAHNYPMSDYARKQRILIGKRVLFNGIALPQTQKCFMLLTRTQEEIQTIANGHDHNYTLADKPGWNGGELKNVPEYERYLTHQS